jgi:hypothetical protein
MPALLQEIDIESEERDVKERMEEAKIEQIK